MYNQYLLIRYFIFFQSIQIWDMFHIALHVVWTSMLFISVCVHGVHAGTHAVVHTKHMQKS